MSSPRSPEPEQVSPSGPKKVLGKVTGALSGAAHAVSGAVQHALPHSSDGKKEKKDKNEKKEKKEKAEHKHRHPHHHKDGDEQSETSSEKKEKKHKHRHKEKTEDAPSTSSPAPAAALSSTAAILVASHRRTSPDKGLPAAPQSPKSPKSNPRPAPPVPFRANQEFEEQITRLENNLNGIEKFEGSKLEFQPGEKEAFEIRLRNLQKNLHDANPDVQKSLPAEILQFTKDLSGLKNRIATSAKEEAKKYLEQKAGEVKHAQAEAQELADMASEFKKTKPSRSCCLFSCFSRSKTKDDAEEILLPQPSKS